MSHVIKLAFLHVRVLFSNVSSPAKMTITARTAPQFCAKTRAERAEVFFLAPIPYGISGNVEPRSECQPKESHLPFTLNVPMSLKGAPE